MKVLFLNMPFSSIRPAIGVSLLKAHLHQMGVASRVLYLNMQFAHQFGAADYQYIAEHTPSQALAGDWVFSRTLFGQRDDADVAYLRAFGERFGRLSSPLRGVGALVRARNMAEAFLQECLAQIDWKSYDVLGFTSTFTQHAASLALACRVKQMHPLAIIVFGGANCEAEMGVQLHRSFPFIDFVCSGEADLSFPRLLQALQAGEAGHGIPGVISRLNGRSHWLRLAPDRVKDLDALPYPDYDDYFEQFARECPSAKSPSPVLMESSRGCWWGEKHHCTFCGLNGTSMAFRSKSASRVLKEIEALCDRYQSGFIEMVDNILDMHYFNDLLPELKKRRLKLGLFYETKANLTKEQLQALCDAGILSIQPGIESFSTDVLRIMRKGTTAIQNIQLLKWCKELGINVLWNLLYGFPGENPTEYEATAHIMDSIHHLQPPSGCSAIRLDRFSPNFTRASELGICNVRADRSYRYIYDLPESDLSELAYYFEYDYADERNPADYVDEVHKALTRWRRAAENHGLLYADHGAKLALWDFRPEARQTLAVLTGCEREVYLLCDQNRSLQQIQALLTEHDIVAGWLQTFLDCLIRDRLMIKLDGRYLALAVKAGSGMPAKCQKTYVRTEGHLVL